MLAICHTKRRKFKIKTELESSFVVKKMLLNENIKEPSFRNKHSLAIRIWHWFTFIIISGSLLTVLLAKYFFSVRDSIPQIQNELKRIGGAIIDNQAKTIAKLYCDKIWDWHTYLGYGLSILFLFRIILEFFQPHDQKFLRSIKNAKKYFYKPIGNKNNTMHYLLVKYIYVGFYIVLGIMIFTGLFMAFSDNNPDLKAIRHIMKNIHSVGLYFILIFIIVHIGGILLAEKDKKNKGVVSDMINGGE